MEGLSVSEGKEELREIEAGEGHTVQRGVPGSSDPSAAPSSSYPSSAYRQPGTVNRRITMHITLGRWTTALNQELHTWNMQVSP